MSNKNEFDWDISIAERQSSRVYWVYLVSGVWDWAKWNGTNWAKSSGEPIERPTRYRKTMDDAPPNPGSPWFPVSTTTLTSGFFPSQIAEGTGVEVCYFDGDPPSIKTYPKARLAIATGQVRAWRIVDTK